MGKNKIITIVLIIIFILALIGGTIWYQNIRKDYEGKEVKQNEQIGNTNGTGEAQKGTNKAKNFSIYDEQGNKVTLDTLRGKPVIINVWTSWCSYCKEEMPDFEELYQQYKDQVQFLMVNVLDGPSETIQNGKKFLQDYRKYDREKVLNDYQISAENRLDWLALLDPANNVSPEEFPDFIQNYLKKDIALERV